MPPRRNVNTYGAHGARSNRSDWDHRARTYPLPVGSPWYSWRHASPAARRAHASWQSLRPGGHTGRAALALAPIQRALFPGYRPIWDRYIAAQRADAWRRLPAHHRRWYGQREISQLASALEEDERYRRRARHNTWRATQARARNEGEDTVAAILARARLAERRDPYLRALAQQPNEPMDQGGDFGEDDANDAAAMEAEDANAAAAEASAGVKHERDLAAQDGGDNARRRLD